MQNVSHRCVCLKKQYNGKNRYKQVLYTVKNMTKSYNLLNITGMYASED